jgi:hypothetical protein
MKLLEAQPEIAPGAPPEPPVERPPDEPAVEPGARTCTSCGAPMEPGQDWCLSCGTAAGKVATRPGVRSAATVFGLTALLLAGAVAASYAALREDQTVPPSQSAAAQVAQAPPAATPPPAAATTPPAATTTTPPAGTTSTGKSTVPKVQVPSNRTPAPAPSAPTTPPATPRQTTPPAATPAPAPSTPTTPSSGGSQTSTGGQTTSPAPAAPVAIDIAASAASVYDPYRRATAVGVPAKAVDGDGSTSWYIDTAAGAPTVGAGFAVNVGQARGIKAIDITTPTPGFKVEIYASDEATPPPTITDTRWAHITDKSDVGADGKTHIVLGAGSSKYQTLLLWITKPPSDGARVRIAELKVFG